MPQEFDIEPSEEAKQVLSPEELETLREVNRKFTEDVLINKEGQYSTMPAAKVDFAPGIADDGTLFED